MVNIPAEIFPREKTPAEIFPIEIMPADRFPIEIIPFAFGPNAKIPVATGRLPRGTRPYLPPILMPLAPATRIRGTAAA